MKKIDIYRNYQKFRKNISLSYKDSTIILKLYPNDINFYYLELFKISVNIKEIGIGTKIMNEICDFCDKWSLTCKLIPTDSFGSDLERLKNFYNRFGFISKNEEMIREPKEFCAYIP